MLTLQIDPYITQILVRIIILFLLMGVVCWLMNKNYQNKMNARSERLQKEYAILTPKKIEEANDTDLVDIVIANLHGKLDEHNPAPFYTIPTLSPERFSLYSVWVIHNELTHGNFSDLLSSPSKNFLEQAVTGCKEIGAEKCADALQEALEHTDDENALADCHLHYMEAIAKEEPLTLCVSYIRSHVDAFIDQEDEPETE